jgi:hypothetical protein
VREERVVDVLGEVTRFLLVLERAVVTALRFFGAGDVSDSSSERIVGRLCFGLVFARLRFELRMGLGVSRWIQRRSANDKGLTKTRHNRALSETYAR